MVGQLISLFVKFQLLDLTSARSVPSQGGDDCCLVWTERTGSIDFLVTKLLLSNKVGARHEVTCSNAATPPVVPGHLILLG